MITQFFFNFSERDTKFINFCMTLSLGKDYNTSSSTFFNNYYIPNTMKVESRKPKERSSLYAP